MIKTALSIIIFSFSVAALPSSAQQFAKDFAKNPNPKNFTTFLNNLSWGDGKPRKFSGLRGCRIKRWDGFNTFYGCKYGYVRIVDPVRGTRLCEIQKHDIYPEAIQALIPFKGPNIGEVRVYYGGAYPCKNL